MAEINPYYARESSVGPVLDLARWSWSKSLINGTLALVVSCGMVAAVAFAWDPQTVFDLCLKQHLPALQELVKPTLKAHEDYPYAMWSGIGFGGAISIVSVMLSVSAITDSLRGNYYLRAGQGGVALRVPAGPSWQNFGVVSETIEVELPWEDIKKICIRQTKQIGAMSRNTGNITANMVLITRDGQRYEFSLDAFDSPAYLIHQRLGEARQDVVVQQLGPADVTEFETSQF